MTTLEDRREADRKRQGKWRQKQAQSGKRAISATISSTAYDALQTLKATDSLSNSAVIGRLLEEAITGGSSDTESMVSLDEATMTLLKGLCRKMGQDEGVVVDRALRMLNTSTPDLMVSDPEDF